MNRRANQVDVAQVGNLRYRRLAVGMGLASSGRCGFSIHDTADCQSALRAVSFKIVNAGFAEVSFAQKKTADCCSLSRWTGEGQGEGLL